MASAVDSAASNGGGKSPRLPRWTRQEILVLIQGKRVAESPGRGRPTPTTAEAAALVGTAALPLEPKWAAVSAFCRNQGVDRGAVQCRKRWSNLAGDFKKIKEWERAMAGSKGESFWGMRNDLRRERRLPGFFDREVYDILDGTAPPPAPAAAAAAPPATVTVEEDVKGEKEEEEEPAEEEDEAVFDSGRPAGEDGLFSDYDEEKEPVEEERPLLEAAAVMPISEKRSEPTYEDTSNPGVAKDKQPAEKGSTSHEGQKRKRTSHEGPEGTNLQSQLIDVLERNSRMLTAHLEAQNVNYQLDRDQRKDHADSLIGVLGKLADALGKIADKL